MGAAAPIRFEGGVFPGKGTILPKLRDNEKQLERDVRERVESALPGVEVLAVELSGPERFTVYVDRAEGVDHGLCARVTDELRDYLREYGIDVSSPGLERPLRTPEHFRAVVGRRIKLRTPERKRLTCEVVAAGDEAFTVRSGDDELQIPYDDVVRANLIDEGLRP
jgi:ribosome maturation factor RimP